MGKTGYHRKSLGQHFLTNMNTAEKIVESAGISPDDTVLEIGPGKGALTGFLVEKAKLVTAVELDGYLCTFLSEKFVGCDNLKIINEDILKTDIGSIAGESGEKIIVVSNMPYNISTPIIEKLIEYRKSVSRAVLMMQKEVAKRLASAPGNRDFGLTTLNLGLFGTISKVMDVKPGAFSPPPEVMSSVLRIEFSEECLYPLKDFKLFRNLTGAVFRQRRKIIKNTIVPFVRSFNIDEQLFMETMSRLGADMGRRPETFSLEEMVGIVNAVYEILPESMRRKE